MNSVYIEAADWPATVNTHCDISSCLFEFKGATRDSFYFLLVQIGG